MQFVLHPCSCFYIHEFCFFFFFLHNPKQREKYYNIKRKTKELKRELMRYDMRVFGLISWQYVVAVQVCCFPFFIYNFFSVPLSTAVIEVGVCIIKKCCNSTICRCRKMLLSAWVYIIVDANVCFCFHFFFPLHSQYFVCSVCQVVFR